MQTAANKPTSIEKVPNKKRRVLVLVIVLLISSAVAVSAYFLVRVIKKGKTNAPGKSGGSEYNDKKSDEFMIEIHETPPPGAVPEDNSIVLPRTG